MKIIVIALFGFLSLFSSITHAQTGPRYLPDRTTVKPYFLQVGFNTSTVIVFPKPVIDADRGFTDIIVEIQKGVENILKIKAATKNFTPTNVHVYTSDGKIYPFKVQYSDQPYCTTFDLNNLGEEYLLAAPLTFTNPVLTPFELHRMADRLRRTVTFFSRNNRKYGICLQLQTIHTAGDVLFFGFGLVNRSNLGFSIDFNRLSIKDKKKGKQTSFQQQEIKTLYHDPVKEIIADSSLRMMIAVPKFTIPDKKEFIIELFEKNGGRHISLKIKNRHLLKARGL